MQLLLDNKALHGLHRSSSTRLETQSFENAMDLGSTNQVCELRALKVLEVAGVTVVRHFHSFAHGPETSGPGLSGFWLILHENFPVLEAAAEPHI